AAKAEAAWGGWENVFDLLEGKQWLDRTGGGDGWYLLGRAWEQEGRWEQAAAAYGRYVALRADTGSARHRGERAVGELRHALALLHAGRVDDGVRALDHARGHVPAVAGWVAVLAAEALAERGDTARVRAFLAAEADLPVPGRARAARLRAHQEAGDVAGVRLLAESYLQATRDSTERAPLLLAAARALLRLGDTATARQRLRTALAEAPATAAARDAAGVLSSLGGLGPADRLAIGIVYDRHGNRARAAEGYRAFLAANPGNADARIRLVRALFAAGRYAEVDAAAAPLAGTAAGAEAMFLTGRAQYRRGARAEARATFLRTADRFPGTAPAAEALFLVADMAHDAGDAAGARAGYARTADRAPGTERAGLALMRLGGMAFTARDYAAAQAAFGRGRTVAAYWPQATYWAARARAARGDTAGAAALYREVRQREPLSYYALRSAERLRQPFWPVPLQADPADADEARKKVAGWMYAVDLLRAAGLDTEARAEVDRRVREAGEDRALLYPLAEAINERGYTSQGIRIALALQGRGEPGSARFLRILYPLPYRGIIQGEARLRELEPALVAAVIRQESWFNARAVSGPGARGLMQVMPETGRGLAMGAGIRQWDADLLFNPEINVALGTRYLAEQMRTYRGSLPSVFGAYNAGPGRIRTWSRFPEYRDEELFTERIPFQETRDYVKILTRNMAVYRGLYDFGR
ncbi:MAG TPA: lytic transglycosylase domain-containing protein, partial [Longimicrobium sp.]|nr:lytic transglycosylase domain-containing protein [Longimicrobium sp.]